MMILHGKDGLIDLQTPIHVTDEQKQQIIAYFNKNFPNIEVMTIPELTKESSSRSNLKENNWTWKEYFDLLLTMDSELMVKKTGRSELSIRMKMGEVIPAFLSWLKEKGLENQIDEENIGRFLKEARGLK